MSGIFSKGQKKTKTEYEISADTPLFLFGFVNMNHVFSLAALAVANTCTVLWRVRILYA